MTDMLYYSLSGLLAFLVLVGIGMMSQVKTAKYGNGLSALSMLFAVVLTILHYQIFSSQTVILLVVITLLAGSAVGLYLSVKVKMIQMPELVALLNGVGGAASALVGGLTLLTLSNMFETTTALLAVLIGVITLVGSVIAAMKLAKWINGRPVVFNHHSVLTVTSLIMAVLFVIVALLNIVDPWGAVIFIAVFSALFGYLFSIRIGGADMPITISLLNSFSGVAGAIAGMAINNVLLVAIGGIVGASGLLLTQIMCKAMNRSLLTILLGKTSVSHTKKVEESVKSEPVTTEKCVDLPQIVKAAKSVIIVPGYGMALAQAQHAVKQLQLAFEKQGASVKYAIHPVAGRMPGHMNVLLAEADVDYDLLLEMEDINPAFKDTDLVVVIGANDVINPAAKTQEGTPIYGMPILHVDEAKHVIICNFNDQPGYAGVANPLYTEAQNVSLRFGDGSETVPELLNLFKEAKTQNPQDALFQVISEAKSVILVPGYGMALSQAQHHVKRLYDAFTQKGASVSFAIHPVAGRMPGHMNVLLAEANVDYDVLLEMDEVNPMFSTSDLVVVIGANDVINPAAKTQEGTPIYGMPILHVDDAKHIIICNFNDEPGYAGVPNPLYTQKEKVTLLFGDAKASLDTLLDTLN